MNRFVWARSGMAAAVALVVAAGGHVGVANAADDGLALKMASSVRDRVFVRAGAIYAKVKTKSGETYDVTGAVVTLNEINQLIANPAIIASTITGAPTPTSATNLATLLTTGGTGIKLLRDQMIRQGLTSIGTPPGITGKAQESIATGGLSIGAYLDDEYKWTVEAYVLAKPISTSVTALGRSTIRESEDPDTGEVTQVVRPFGLEGQKIINTKFLPPVVMFGRYWGDRASGIRPYTGVMGMYAMFYDTKASEALNTYVGGTTPGATTVSIKNKFGFGPVLGVKVDLNNSWHASFNIASVKLKTQATLVTRNSFFDKNTPAIQDFGKQPGDTFSSSISDTIMVGETAYSVGGNAGSAGQQAIIAANGGLTAIVTRSVAKLRGQSSELSTYVRKTDTELDSTLFMLSVGRSF